ncbi:beta-ketoacyl synthase [Isoalcanivorax beigongshangi]|uniref:Beta-ketoacyl synthase n=1 Tax=Isoalcanivorax beigongshangi TaxID=3238810 RepID=A0ABV4AJ00_9GAMM
MAALPVITALGGISPAGRSACHHGYHRLVFDALSADEQARTLAALAALDTRGRFGGDAEALLEHTLVRRLDPTWVDADNVPISVQGTSNAPLKLEVRNMDLPQPLPAHWQVTPLDGRRSEVLIPAGSALLLPSSQRSKVQSAGQLPGGFDPAQLYASRNHPRGLQMAVYSASEALGMLGIDWSLIQRRLPPEQVAVYASSAMAQLDDCGLGGLFRNPASGKRITSKQVPLGLGEMPADFINAYVLGALGSTGGMLGACATFHYNLLLGVQDIRAGRRRLVLVGTSEAPLVPEVIEGYRAMGALGEDEALLKLDPHRDQPDHRRACRPFGYNIGFTIAESAQFVVLMDDALALELGADILGAVPDVFIHADGPKKSISAPGVGNYLTLARAAALTRQLIGSDGLRHHSFVHAHGTGTPQNRVTESDVLHRVAEAFDIRDWPVAAIKCYVGHSLGTAGGDQLAATLGTFAHGLLPGIFTLDQVADDVHGARLGLHQQHQTLERPQAALLNSKGFGGNNATAVVLSPQATSDLLARRHGHSALADWQQRVQATRQQVADWDAAAVAGSTAPRYHFGEGVLDGPDLTITDHSVAVPGWDQPLALADDPEFAAYVG